MKNAIIISIIALIASGISIWMNVRWQKIYADCGQKKEECIKVCREEWKASREEINKEIQRVDSLIAAAGIDTAYFFDIEMLRSRRARFLEDRLNTIFPYFNCKDSAKKIRKDTNYSSLIL